MPLTCPSGNSSGNCPSGNLQKTLPSVTAPVNDKFVPTDATKPADFRTVTQNGEKSMYIEHNVTSITIS